MSDWSKKQKITYYCILAGTLAAMGASTCNNPPARKKENIEIVIQQAEENSHKNLAPKHNTRKAEKFEFLGEQDNKQPDSINQAKRPEYFPVSLEALMKNPSSYDGKFLCVRGIPSWAGLHKAAPNMVLLTMKYGNRFYHRFVFCKTPEITARLCVKLDLEIYDGDNEVIYIEGKKLDEGLFVERVIVPNRK